MSNNYATALEAAGATVLAFQSFGSYQGDWWAKVRFEDKTVWVHGYYGSCSGCDSFNAEFTWEGDKCDEHAYNDAAAAMCLDCQAAAQKYADNLARFGARYLEPSEVLDQAAAEKKVSENLDWDLDAVDMLKWIQQNKINTIEGA